MARTRSEPPAVAILLEPQRSRLPRPHAVLCLLAGLLLFSAPAVLRAFDARVAFVGLVLLVPLYVGLADLSRLLSLHRGGASEEIGLAGYPAARLSEAVAWHSARSTLRVMLPLALGMLPGAATLGVGWLVALVLWVPGSYGVVAAGVCVLGVLLPAATRSHRLHVRTARSRRLPIGNPLLYRELTRWLAGGGRAFRIPWGPLAVAGVAGAWAWMRLDDGRGDLAVPCLAAAALGFFLGALRALASATSERERRTADLLASTRLTEGEILFGRAAAATLPAAFETALAVAVFLGIEAFRIWPAGVGDESPMLFLLLLVAPPAGALLGLEAARAPDRREAAARLLGAVLQVALASGLWFGGLLALLVWLAWAEPSWAGVAATAILLGLGSRISLGLRGSAAGQPWASQAFLVLGAATGAVALTGLGPLGRGHTEVLVACVGSLLLTLPGLVLLYSGLGEVLQAGLSRGRLGRAAWGGLMGVIAGFVGGLAVPLWGLFDRGYLSVAATWTGLSATLTGGVVGAVVAALLPAAAPLRPGWLRPAALVALVLCSFGHATPARPQPDPLAEASRRHVLRVAEIRRGREIDTLARSFSEWRWDRLVVVDTPVDRLASLLDGDACLENGQGVLQLRSNLTSRAWQLDAEGRSDEAADLHLLSLRLRDRVLGSDPYEAGFLCYDTGPGATHLRRLLASDRVSDERLRLFLDQPRDCGPRLARAMDHYAVQRRDPSFEGHDLPGPLLRWLEERDVALIARAFPRVVARARTELIPGFRGALQVDPANPEPVRELTASALRLVEAYRTQATWAEAHRIVAALELHHRTHGGYPASLDGLLDPAPVAHTSVNGRFQYSLVAGGYRLSAAGWAFEQAAR